MIRFRKTCWYFGGWEHVWSVVEETCWNVSLKFDLSHYQETLSLLWQGRCQLQLFSHLLLLLLISVEYFFLKLGIRWCCRFNVWYYQLRLELMNKTHKQCLNHPQLQQTSPSWLEWFLWSIFNDLITMFVWMIIFTQTETVATKWKWFSNNQSQLHIYYHQLYAFTIITIGIIITIIIICITFIIIIISKWGKSCWRIQFVRSHLPRFLFECNQKWFNASCIHFDFDSIKK